MDCAAQYSVAIVGVSGRETTEWLGLVGERRLKRLLYNFGAKNMSFLFLLPHIVMGVKMKTMEGGLQGMITPQRF